MINCNTFYQINLEPEWYKTQVLEVYLSLNKEERLNYTGQIYAHQRLENLEDEFELYQNKIEMKNEQMEIELYKFQKRLYLENVCGVFGYFINGFHV